MAVPRRLLLTISCAKTMGFTEIGHFDLEFASKRYRDLPRFSVLSHLLPQTAYRTPKFSAWCQHFRRTSRGEARTMPARRVVIPGR